MNDELFMKAALQEARKAADKDEVPIGAIAVLDGKVLSSAHNIREATNDPLGHAELLLLQKIVDEKALTTWRFEDVTVYVTCEPCLMCMGAMLQARVKRIVFGCFDAKAGACGSVYDVSNNPRLNHRIEVTSGVLREECAEMLSEFFKRLRRKNRSSGL